jgi:hypothetical protein
MDIRDHIKVFREEATPKEQQWVATLQAELGGGTIRPPDFGRVARALRSLGKRRRHREHVKYFMRMLQGNRPHLQQWCPQQVTITRSSADWVIDTGRLLLLTPYRPLPREMGDLQWVAWLTRDAYSCWEPSDLSALAPAVRRLRSRHRALIRRLFTLPEVRHRTRRVAAGKTGAIYMNYYLGQLRGCPIRIKEPKESLRLHVCRHAAELYDAAQPGPAQARALLRLRWVFPQWVRDMLAARAPRSTAARDGARTFVTRKRGHQWELQLAPTEWAPLPYRPIRLGDGRLAALHRAQRLLGGSVRFERPGPAMQWVAVVATSAGNREWPVTRQGLARLLRAVRASRPSRLWDSRLGWRVWVLADDGYLASPVRGSKWVSPALTAEQWNESDSLRGVAGIHALRLPSNWRHALWFHDLNVGSYAIFGIVERFGRAIIGEDGWRAEHAIIRALVAPDAEAAAALALRYPEIEILVAE